MKKWISISLPAILGLMVAFGFLLLKIGDITIVKIDFVLNAIITCVVTLAGFILTSLSIIISMSNSAIMTKIRKKGGLQELSMRYSVTLFLSLIMICTYITLGANMNENNIIGSQWVIGCSGLTVAYIVSLITTLYYLIKIISLIPITDNLEINHSPSVPTGKFR